MTPNPNNPTPGTSPGLTPGTNDPILGETLLDEALAEATPAELEAKILELTDPTMLSLLDEALAPEVNDQLTQRILAATAEQAISDPSPRLADSEPRRAGHAQPTVLARIGPSTFRYAAAAVIALAVGLGVYFVNQGPEDTGTSIVENTGTDVEGDTGDTPDWLANEQYASENPFFDIETSPLEATLKEASISVEDATITRDTLWAELDAYEQFLDDIES